MVRNLRQVLGDELSPEETERLPREFFRLRSCEVIDVMLLRGQARSLGKLVEIRGREHLDAARAAGKGSYFAAPTSVPIAAAFLCCMPAGSR